MSKIRFVDWIKDHVLELIGLFITLGLGTGVYQSSQVIREFASKHFGDFLLLSALSFALGFFTCFITGLHKYAIKQMEQRHIKKEREKLEFQDACNRIQRLDWASKEILLGIRDGKYASTPNDEWEMLRHIPTLHGFLRGAEFAKDKTHVELTKLARKAMKACPDALDIERDIAD